MVETATPTDVVDALRNKDAQRIGIDGIDGCGKTTLANEVAAGLGYRLFSLDDYLERDKGRFLDFIEYPRLSADAGLEGTYVIEGVCLLNALRRAGLTIDTLVYVKRRHLGQWADEDELNLSEPLEDFLEGQRKLTGMLAGAPLMNLGLAEEIIRYHYVERPHTNAHIVYFRDER